jgi:SAM-dependent methyltransferase
MRCRTATRAFRPEVFDVVISTGVLEHARNWCLVVSNLKHVVKPGGVLLLTTRSFGFPYHPWPYDFWRYEKDDLRAIFSDMDILVLESDPQLPGVLMKSLKPQAFVEVPPQESMYSVILGRRARSVSTVAWRTYVATVPLQNLYRRAVLEPARVRINRVRAKDE